MMYVRVTRGQYRDAASANTEAVNQLTDELFRTMRAMPGNQSYTGGRDSAGRVIAISIWDTEEHAHNLQAALGDIRPKLEAQGLKIDPPEVFEVTISSL
jgi:quinol monooxygenase YgiN